MIVSGHEYYSNVWTDPSAFRHNSVSGVGVMCWLFWSCREHHEIKFLWATCGIVPQGIGPLNFCCHKHFMRTHISLNPSLPRNTLRLNRAIDINALTQTPTRALVRSIVRASTAIPSTGSNWNGSIMPVGTFHSQTIITLMDCQVTAIRMENWYFKYLSQVFKCDQCQLLGTVKTLKSNQYEYDMYQPDIGIILYNMYKVRYML